MKKKFKVKNILTKSTLASTTLLAGSAGIVFGISAGMYKVNYMDLTNAEARVLAARMSNYYSQNIKSGWNMLADPDTASDYQAWAPTKKEIQQSEDWNRLHKSAPMFNPNDRYLLDPATAYGDPIADFNVQNRRKYVSMVLDGSSHSALDHSFNQSLFQGFLNFVNNKDMPDPKSDTEISVYKPGQDTTPYFQEIYREAAHQSRVVGLAGFIHVTPLSTIGSFDSSTGLYDFNNKELDQTGFILIDGDIPNNQNVASVLFRADQPGFLAGISTCMYFYNNLGTYHDKYQDISVGVYGGSPIPTVVIYMGGFQRGIEFFNHFVLKRLLLNIRVRLEHPQPISDDKSDEYKLYSASKYKDNLDQWADNPAEYPETIKNKLIAADGTGYLYDEFSIKMIKLGDFGTHFTGTFVAGDAIGITKQYLNRGAAAILPVAGPQTVDTTQEILSQNNNCIVLGVDAAMENGDDQRKFQNKSFYDQTLTPDGSHSEQKENILKFSAIKDMTSVTRNFSTLAMKQFNWDNDGRPWNHTYVPNYSDEKTLTISADNCKFDFIESTQTATIKEVTADLEGKTSIIFPENIEVNNKTYTITTIGDGKSPIISDYKNVRNLKFECKNKLFISNYAFENAFKDDGRIPNCLDFGSIPETATLSFGEAAFKEIQGSGLLILNSELTRDEKDSFTDSTKINDDWWYSHPDPDKAICNIGFKTCGNIQNGLISVSFDGFYYLMRALVNIFGKGSFTDEWRKKVKQFFIENPNAIPDRDERERFTANATAIALTPEDYESFPDGLKEAGGTGLLTLSRTNLKDKTKPSDIYAHYNIVMNILGMLLDDTELEFPANMTILAGSEADPQIATETQTMSILDWLSLNMYFTC